MNSLTASCGKEVVTMIDIDTVIDIIILAVTAVGLGLQLEEYINSSKNDRRPHKLDDR